MTGRGGRAQSGWGRRAGCLSVALAVLWVLVIACRTVGIPIFEAPARWNVGAVGAVVAEADSLMADPTTHGVYGGPTYSQRARGSVAPVASFRPLAELPPALRATEPVQVTVGTDGVRVAWDPRGWCAYGYCMYVVSEREQERTADEMHAQDGNFQSNSRLGPRVWSHYQYH